MCGFVGGTLVSGNYERGIEAIRHRGPDDQQIWRDDLVTLAFARLAIVDLEARSSQPMHSPDGKVKIVFNGEIYGYRNLRDRLQGLGHLFRTTSDTEVLLHAYLQWGNGFVEHIDGMFAIAIYDQTKSELQLWRDRVGIKPLYYFWNGKDLVFASEIKAILAVLPARPAPRLDAYYDFLTYQAVPAPKTSFQSIHQLRPAHQIRLSLKDCRLSQPQRYWQVAVDVDDSLTQRTASSAIREALSESVSDQLVSDVPVGCFLSGGVDSSVIAYESSKNQRSIMTFTVGFRDSHDERQDAAETACFLGTNHFEEVLDPIELELPLLAKWFDDPFGDTSAFPTFLVAKSARQHVTVALSGDGADELFGGYWRYNAFAKRQFGIGFAFHAVEKWKMGLRRHTMARRLLNLTSYCLAPSLSMYTKLMGGMTPEEKQWMTCQFEIPRDYDPYWAWREYWRPELPARTRLQFLDFHTYLPDTLLPKVDRTSMANSLEVRVPFLSQRMVELAFQIGEDIRFNGGSKGVLKSAYSRELYHGLLARTKRGFGIPNSFLDAKGCDRLSVILEQAFRVDTSAVDKQTVAPRRCDLGLH